MASVPPTSSSVTRLGWTFSPEEAMRRWPADMPLASLLSPGGQWGIDRPGTPDARWSILTSPLTVHVLPPDEPDPLGELAKLVGESTQHLRQAANQPPFMGGWLMALGYELGHAIEPATRPISGELSHELWPWPIVLWRCPWAYVFDHADGRWLLVREHSAGLSVLPGPDLAACAPRERSSIAPMVSDLHSTCGCEQYVDAVARAVEYIYAGDVFQVNLAHRLRAKLHAEPRAMFNRMHRRAAPRFGAYLELAHPETGILHAAASISPELFLSFDSRTRRLVTRPIKGTIRATSDAAAAKLHSSEKDQAELNMIIDLMRNDLSRVASPRSVRVDEARVIERHADGPAHADSQAHGGATAIYHGVATVSCELLGRLGVVDAIKAAFPAGSITGAPKVRAMQIIRELEGSPRGLYTGAIGFLSCTGDFSLSVAIRTATAASGVVEFPVGAGIVADSVPAHEWDETLDKARVFTKLAEAEQPDHAPAFTHAPTLSTS